MCGCVRECMCECVCECQGGRGRGRERESMTEGPVDRRESIEFKAYVTSLTSRVRSTCVPTLSGC